MISFGCQKPAKVFFLQVRYREDLDLVLTDISLSIKPREKIGIVGRTGCGKSTLVSTLFRSVDPTAGRVVIDGHDLAQVPLHQLRSNLAFVPQVRAPRLLDSAWHIHEYDLALIWIWYIYLCITCVYHSCDRIILEGGRQGMAADG